MREILSQTDIMLKQQRFQSLHETGERQRCSVFRRQAVPHTRAFNSEGMVVDGDATSHSCGARQHSTLCNFVLLQPNLVQLIT